MDKSDREGPHSFWRRILLLIGRQMDFHPKVELSHAVVLGVIGPHRCEDFTDRAEVLLNRSLIDRLSLRGQKARTDTLGENIEEGSGVLNVLEAGAIWIQLQKRRHWRQAVEYFLNVVAENPWVISCFAAW